MVPTIIRGPEFDDLVISMSKRKPVVFTTQNGEGNETVPVIVNSIAVGSDNGRCWLIKGELVEQAEEFSAFYLLESKSGWFKVGALS